MNIQEIVSAWEALKRMGSYGGISVEQNRKMRVLYVALNQAVQEFKEMEEKLYDEYAVEIPKKPFIPAQDYENFKNEMMSLEVPGPIHLQCEQFKQSMKRIFEKYEKMSNYAGDRGIPMDVSDEYREKAENQGVAFLRKIEFEPLAKDKIMEEVIRLLPGFLQEAIDFAFDEGSRIIMPFSTITLQ